MTKRLKQLGWKLDSKTEIVLKQIYAYLLHGFGFTVNLNLQQIMHGPFVDSLVKKDKGNYQELPPPFINEQNIAVLDSIFDDLYFTQIYKAQLLSTTTASHDIDQYLPLRTHAVFDNYAIQDIQRGFFSLARNDWVDTPLMRYLHFTKGNLDKAMTLCVKHLHWRTKTHPVEQYIQDGDYQLFRDDPDSQIIYSLRLNHVYIRGRDRKGRPLVTVEVYKHFRSDCPDEDFERIICLIIEWTRLKLLESNGITKGTLLFDLTDFSLANSDLHAVRFLVNIFQQYYPEYLGLIIIHNAPWIFYTIWKIIRTWLDPVISSRIVFTFRYGDLEKLIAPEWISTRLGGNDGFEFQYIEPTKSNSRMKPVDEKFKRLIEKRRMLTLQFIEATLNWVHAESQQESYNYLVQRLRLQKQLAKNYIDMDPYVRTRGVFDRNGEIDHVGY